MSTIEISMPQEIQEAANQIIGEAGFTLDEVVQRLMQRIVQEHSVPEELLYDKKNLQESDETIRKQAFLSIKQWHKRVIGSPMTIEEIISARDEGRK